MVYLSMMQSHTQENELATLRRAHEEWLASSGRQGRRAVFRAPELCDQDLSGAQLSQASFKGLTIRNVNFAGADLSGCDLSETIIENTDFTGARLSHCQMTRARLAKVKLDGADLSEAVLLGIAARELSFQNARIEKGILRDANLQNAGFAGAQLSQACLRGAMLLNACLDQADMRGADCRGAIFDRASFAYADVAGAHFKDATLHAINLYATDFTGALELAFDPQVQELVDERLRLQQKQRTIAEQIGLVNKDKRKLAAQEAELTLREARFERALRALKRTSVAYAALCAGWLALAAFLLSFTVMRVTELGISRIYGVVVVVGLVVILSFLSFYFAFKTRLALLEVLGREHNARGANERN